MKRNQKKYTKKNYKGGVVGGPEAKESLAKLNERLDSIQQQLGILRTKIERKEVEVAKLLGPETNPMDKKSIDLPTRRNAFTDKPPSSGMFNSLGASKSYEKNTPNNFSGENPLARQKKSLIKQKESIPIEINEDQFNRVRDALRGMQKGLSERSEIRYNFQKNVLKLLGDKLTDRSNYLKTKPQLNSEEQTELGKINSFLNLVNQAIATDYKGGRKSRKYIKSRRTRKHKK